MKKTFSAKAILAAGIGLLIAGCVTPIADLEVTQFDRGAVKNTYGAEVAKKIKAKYAKKVHVTLAASEEATPAMAKHRDYLSDAITPALTALSYFKVSTTKNLGAIIKMNKTAEITGGETKNVSVEATDFMITYKLVSCDFVKNKGLAIAGSLAGSVAPAAGSVATELDTRAQAELNVSLVNVADQSTIDFALVGVSELGKAGDKNLLKNAIKDAIDQLVARLASKFGPPGKVVATKGEGTAVQVNIGRRFGARVGSTFDFFEYSEDEDSKELIEVPIAAGKIIENDADYLEDKKCWVRLEKPGVVQKNTLVRLRGTDK